MSKALNWCRTHNIKVTLYVWLLSSILFTLPFSVRINSILIIICCVYYLTFILPKHTIKFSSAFLPPVLLFTVYTIGLLYSPNLKEGILEIEQKLSFLILPFLIYAIPMKKDEYVSIFFKVWIIANLVALLVALSISIYYCVDQELSFKLLFYKSLGESINIHPVYFSCYILFALFILHFYYGTNSLWKQLLFIFFSIGVLLLSSRIIILLYLLFLLYISLRFIKRITVLGQIVSLIILLLLILAIFQTPVLKERMKELNNLNLMYLLTADSLDANYQIRGAELRVLNVRAFGEIMQEENSYIAGVGTGGNRYFLDQKISTYRYKTYQDHKYPMQSFNFHNQFLETSMSIGLIGLSLLIMPFFYCFKYSVKAGNKLLFSFALLCFMIFLTESFLERQKGIIFFTFFYSILTRRNR